MTQTELQNVQELARQGNPKAIANLINRSLAPRGIQVKTFIKEKCLSVFLESTQDLDKNVLTKFVEKGLSTLGIETIRSVKLYGKKKGIESPLWIQEFPLSSFVESVTPEVELLSPKTVAIQPIQGVRTTTPHRKKVISSEHYHFPSFKHILMLSISSTVLLLIFTIVGSAFWLRSSQEQAITQADGILTNVQDGSDIDILRNNQAYLRDAIEVLEDVPKFFLFDIGTLNTKMHETQTELIAVERDIRDYEEFIPFVQDIVDQFSALDSSLDVGMTYRQYGQEVRELKISLDRFGRRPGATEHPVYQSLVNAFERYNFAYEVWQYYIEHDGTNHFFPASSWVGRVLVSNYQFRPHTILGRQYIYLDDALSTVWLQASQRVQLAQSQMQ